MFRPSAGALAWMRHQQEAYNGDSYAIWRAPAASGGKRGPHELLTADVAFTIYPAGGNGRHQKAFEPLAGARTTHYATTAYGTDVEAGDQLRGDGRIFMVDGASHDWQTAVLLALSEVKTT